MEWLRRYGSWFICGLIALSIVARFLNVSNSGPSKQMRQEMVEALRKGQEQQALWDNSILGASSEWKKREKGDDSDTLLIAYYDSLVRITKNRYTGMQISERIRELKTLVLARRYKKLLPGTWELVSYFDPRLTEQKRLKKATLTFESDSTFTYVKKGEKTRRASFRIFETAQTLPELEMYPDENCPDDHYGIQHIRISNDTLYFKSETYPMNAEFVYVRKK